MNSDGGFDDENGGQNGGDLQEDSEDSQSEYYEATHGDQISKSMPMVPDLNAIQNVHAM